VDEFKDNAGEGPQSFPTLVSSINQYLPEDIQLFSCVRMTQGFSARSGGSWRAYEYILPLRLLQSSTTNQALSDESLLEKFNSYLLQLEGCHDFHNFHRMKGKEIKYRSRRKTLPMGSRNTQEKEDCSTKIEKNNQEETVLSEVSDSDNENEEEEEESESDGNSKDKSHNFSAPIESGANVYEKWEEIPRLPSLTTRSIIFRCQGNIISRDGEKYIRVSIIGQHFLLHQIRLMISAAVMSTNNLVPDYFISLAKLNQILYHIPLAPSNGLVLVNTGFKDVKRQDMASSRKTMQNPSTICICNDEEDAMIEEFLQKKIYPQIFSDWRDNEWQRLSEYITFSERFRVPQNLREEWQVLHSRLVHETTEEEKNKIKKDISRVQKNLQHISSSYSEKVISKFRNEYTATDFLPGTLTTSLARYYHITPGSIILNLNKVLATKVINREISDNVTVEGIIEYLEKAGLPSHPFDTQVYTINNEANVKMLTNWLQSQSIHPIFDHQFK